MKLQQQHLPKDRPARPEQEWGFTIQEFITENWLYLGAILLILIIFFLARIGWSKKNKQEKKNKQ